MARIIWTFILAVTLCVGLAKAASPFDHFGKPVETFVVDLDKPPEDRWTELIKRKRADLHLLLHFLRPMFMKHAALFTEEIVHAVNESMSQEYVRELEGIARAGEATYFDALMANLFYEISGIVKMPLDLSRSCTSIVAQRSNGTVYFARNQDYPPPFTLVMVHAVFKRNNKTVYEGTTFAGTIGLSTGYVPHGFGVSINARSNGLHNTTQLILDAVKAAKRGASIFPIFTRQVIERAGGEYQKAVDLFVTQPLIRPGYIIVGGIKSGEGVVITRNASKGEADLYPLFNANPSEAGGKWYVVQTNTDHWEKAPIIPILDTSRRATAAKHLEKIGRENIDLHGLWEVLSTVPVFNYLTIHTDLAVPAWGEYQTYKRFGPLAAQKVVKHAVKK